MFKEYFLFSKVNHTKPKQIGNYKLIEHIYSFRGNKKIVKTDPVSDTTKEIELKKRYIVIAEEYQYFVYVIKFCLQERKIYDDRFNQLTGLNECSRVLTTVGQIIKFIYSKNPYASFGFIGSPLPDEHKENTKRFRLYSEIVSQLISPVAFEHYQSKKLSAYLLLNRDNHEQDLYPKIEKMFDDIFILRS